MRRMLPLILGTLGLVACGAFVFALAYRHNLRIDLTANRGYTLSPHARKILADLDRDVHVTVFVRAEDPRTPFIKDLLWRVASESPRVSYEFVDINRSPATAERYGVDRYGALVFQSGQRRRDIGNPDESLVMSAILAVTREQARVVYFVTGHGERSPTESDRKAGGSIAARALEDDLFEVRALSLIPPTGVPLDAAVLVVAGPRKDFLPEEMTGLEAYLSRGGNLLLLLDPEAPETLVAFAARWGVTPLADVVVDPLGRLAAGEGETFKVAELARSFPVSGTLETAPVLSSARPLRVDPPGTDEAVAFLQTSTASYARAAGQPHRDATQRVGALTVGVALFRTDGVGGRGGRLIVIGDSDFASNGVIEYLGNKDLLVNSVSWLAGDASLIAARAQTKALGREQFFVTEAQGKMAFWLATVAQPLAFLLLGALVVVRRRLR
jgi:gliding motility-associatede transport system auxiliary component